VAGGHVTSFPLRDGPKKIGRLHHEKIWDCTSKKFGPTPKKWTPKKMARVAICAYEQERLDNIARNQEVLRSLGLGDGLVPPKPKAPPRSAPKIKDIDPDLDGAEALPVRRSSRVAKAPVQYTELPDDFCLEEEKQLMGGRPSRDRKRIITYAQKQGEEIEAAEAKNVLRRAKQQRAIAADLARRQQAAESSSVGDSPVSSASVTTIPPCASMPRPSSSSIIFAPNNSRGYHTDGKCAECPICKGIFVVRKLDGQIRTHSCQPVDDALVLPDAN
jgi:hypothetical protein